jgi:hypothetical protein
MAPNIKALNSVFTGDIVYLKFDFIIQFQLSVLAPMVGQKYEHLSDGANFRLHLLILV